MPEALPSQHSPRYAEVMLDHISVAVSDVAAARSFYAAALAPLGYRVAADFGDVFAVGAPGLAGGDPAGEVWFGQDATPKPTHLAFTAEDGAQVRAFYEAALAAGGTDNGGPGERPHYHPGYYAAFVRDPDGNNIEAVCHTWSVEND